MNKNVRQLTECLRETFSPEFIDRVSKKTKFVQRESQLTADKFLFLCTFYGDSICKESLSKLSAILAAEDNILISPQALHERFNEYSVEFLKNILKELLLRQNSFLAKDNKVKNLFNRINVVDSTGFKISDNLKDVYPGTGGHSASAAIKIQLNYDILSGQFLACDLTNGSKNDSEYLPEIQKFIQPKDLFLKDLGYFKMEDLNIIDVRKAYYISKIKKYTIISIYDGKKYSQVDILEKVKDLNPGEILDIPHVALGSKKNLKSRLIITKLSEENKIKRQIRDKEENKGKKRRMDPERLDLWNSINIYITNISEDDLDAAQIHDLYTLRWQVEIMFKVWKSIFKINNIKKVQQYRFECFIYGKLLSILINSMIVFKAKNSLPKHSKEISELKAFAVTKEMTCKFKQLLRGKISDFTRHLNGVFKSIYIFSCKTKSKKKKTSGDILNSIRI